MTITEAIEAVSDEYDDEARRARKDLPFALLASKCMGNEYDEIDQKLPGYVAQIVGGMSDLPSGTALPDYVYVAARMCFRLGMRTQRKLDHPDQVTSIFWRSDEVKI